MFVKSRRRTKKEKEKKKKKGNLEVWVINIVVLRKRGGSAEITGWLGRRILRR